VSQAIVRVAALRRLCLLTRWQHGLPGRREEPELERWPELARPLMFGPLTPVSFRMSGRDSLADAPERFAAEVQAFGCVPSNQLIPMQIGQLQGLAEARGDETFSRYVATVCPSAEMVVGN
jgi:hypothetical protein